MFSSRGTHITREMRFQVGEHTSLGICVSWAGEHISLSLGICVSQVREHISLGICVTWVGEHISLGIVICVSLPRKHIPRDMCSPTKETHIPRDMCFLGRGTYITRDMCFRVGELISLGICDICFFNN